MIKTLPFAFAALIFVFALPVRAQAPAPAAAPELTDAPEYRALVAKEDAALEALDKKNENELLEKLKGSKPAGAKAKKTLEAALKKLIEKHAAAEGKLAAEQTREREAYVKDHAPKPAATAQEAK